MNMVVTELAQTRLNELIGDQLREKEAAIRVFIQAGGCGCSGPQFGMGLDQAAENDSVMEFEDEECARLVTEALEMGETCGDILDEGLIAAMDTIGDLFGRGELFVPEMLIAARAMKAGLEVLRPILTASKEPPKGIVVMATVQGDLPDIGKNLVCMMLEGAGFEIVDLGVNTDPMSIIEHADKVGADIIGLSALLTTSMPFMKLTIEAFEREGKDYPIIVGGAPVTRDYADRIKATGYADNAVDAVILCKKLIADAKAMEVERVAM